MTHPLRLGFFLSLLLATQAGFAQSRLAIPSYVNPAGPIWTSWAAPGKQSIGIMIVNEDNGDDVTRHPAVAAAIARTRAAGIFVIGYVYTGYGKRDLATVESRIDAVFQNYLVDGIFFDEAPTDCGAANPNGGDNYAYYQELAEHVRSSTIGGRIVVMNPGTQPFNDCWMGITNILVTAESSSLSDYQTDYIDQPWFHKYPADRFWHIVYNADAAAESAILSLSQARGAGWLYVTDGGSANPYDAVPTYWLAETNAVATQDLQSLYSNGRPASENGNGNTVVAKVDFRWQSLTGASWNIYISDAAPAVPTPSPSGPTGLVLAPQELVTISSTGVVSTYVNSGTASNPVWSAAALHGSVFSLANSKHLATIDSTGLASTVAYQIQSFDASGTLLATSLPLPLSLTNYSHVFEIENH